jgi:hypothetical protein
VHSICIRTPIKIPSRDTKSLLNEPNELKLSHLGVPATCKFKKLAGILSYTHQRATVRPRRRERIPDTSDDPRCHISLALLASLRHPSIHAHSLTAFTCVLRCMCLRAAAFSRLYSPSSQETHLRKRIVTVSSAFLLLSRFSPRSCVA